MYNYISKWVKKQVQKSSSSLQPYAYYFDATDPVEGTSCWAGLGRPCAATSLASAGSSRPPAWSTPWKRRWRFRASNWRWPNASSSSAGTGGTAPLCEASRTEIPTVHHCSKKVNSRTQLAFFFFIYSQKLHLQVLKRDDLIFILIFIVIRRSLLIYLFVKVQKVFLWAVAAVIICITFQSLPRFFLKFILE